MQNKRLILALAGAIIFGLIATFSITRYLANAQAYQQSLGEIVVAKNGISLGTKITADQLTMIKMPNGSRPEGAFDSIEKVVGRVAITGIGVREPITDYRLATQGAAGGLPAVIPDGYRAMTVKVDDVVGVSGFVTPGAFVDVVVVINPMDQSQGPISKIVLQSIKVVASGQKIDQPKDEREPHLTNAVTLLVLPEQAEKLALATSEGKLQLVMRGYSDQEDSYTSGASKRTLLTGEPVSVPQALRLPSPPAPAATPASRVATAVAPRPARARVLYTPVEGQTAVAPVRAAQHAAPVRSVQLIEGAKKHNVDFP